MSLFPRLSPPLLSVVFLALIWQWSRVSWLLYTSIRTPVDSRATIRGGTGAPRRVSEPPPLERSWGYHAAGDERRGSSGGSARLNGRPRPPWPARAKPGFRLSLLLQTLRCMSCTTPQVYRRPNLTAATKHVGVLYIQYSRAFLFVVRCLAAVKLSTAVLL